MNTEQLLCTIQSDDCLRTIVSGVYALDTIPLVVSSYPTAFIINTDVSTGPGKHWVVIWFNNVNEAEFFDSFGNKPERFGDTLRIFLENNAYSYMYNKRQLQQHSSEVCGYYVLYVLLLKCFEMSYSDILNSFTVDRKLNDEIVYDTVRKYFENCTL